MHNVSVNYCITCRDRGIKKEIIVNQYSPSDICNDCKPKSIDAKSVIVGNEQVPYDDLISSTLTGWGDKTIQMHYIDKKILSLDAIALIKELSLICGVNARKYSKDESWKDYDNRVKMSGDNPTGEIDCSLSDKFAEINTLKHEAINLLKEIRIISGVQERNLLTSSRINCSKVDKNISLNFNYINKLIDVFVSENKLTGFKK